MNVNAWDVFEADLGWGAHPVVVVSHPARAARKELVPERRALLCAWQAESSRGAMLRAPKFMESRFDSFL